MSAVTTYVHDILRRARVPMEPFDYSTDWADQPRRHKVYPDAELIGLTAGRPERDRTLAEALGPADGDPDKRFDLASLAQMLWFSYGITGRRLVIHRNDDVPAQANYVRATWSRGVSSGGGLYSLETYLVTTGEAGLVPGIYSWSNSRHGLARIATGNYVARVDRALSHPGSGPGTYLLVTVKFWKNSFKYNTFAPHVTATDIGTMLSTWHVWCRAQGLPMVANLWFDEPALNEVLGIDGMAETVVAVVPAPMGAEAHASSHSAPPHHTEAERSMRTWSFPINDAVQKELLAAACGPDGRPTRFAPPRPRSATRGRQSARRAPIDVIALPDPKPSSMPLTEVIVQRRSSFGRFAPQPRLTQAELSALLYATAATNQGFGIAEDPGEDLIGVWVCVNHVEGLKPGIYRFDDRAGTLELTLEAELGAFLQRNYFLRNYNLEKTAAVIVVTGWPGTLMANHGPRAFRLQNAAVGAACQYAYLAASSLGIGCGAALGFDNVSYAEALGTAQLDRDDPAAEWPLLVLLVGHEDAEKAELRCQVELRTER